MFYNIEMATQMYKLDRKETLTHEITMQILYQISTSLHR